MRTIASYAEEANDLRQNLQRTREQRDAFKKDAERYRWLIEQDWHSGQLAVVKNPKQAIKLGYDAPSRTRLDAMIDAALSGVSIDGV